MSSPPETIHIDATNEVLHRRTVRYAVTVAFRKVRPDLHLKGGYSIHHSYYYDADGRLSDQDLVSIQTEIDAMIQADEPIMRSIVPYEEAVRVLSEQNQRLAVKFLETRVKYQVPVHTCRGETRLGHHALLPSMGKLVSVSENYTLNIRPIQSHDGFLAIWSKEFVPQPAILDAVHEHSVWDTRIGVSSVGELNRLAIDGKDAAHAKFILNAEFRQESKLAHIASLINTRSSTPDMQCTTVPIKLIAIAGPTSSGKTTFAHKLAMYLENYGFATCPLSVDHYYYSLEDQPQYKARKDRADVDYDSIEAMDIPLINEHIQQLIDGKTIMSPEYDFYTGKRVGSGHPVCLPNTGILIIEGIHALNPAYLASVDTRRVFRIFISPITTLQVDDFNALKTTNHRLLRRMCRDYLFRGYPAGRTLANWNKVRRGEVKYIFEHQNNADFVMNSAMEYELAVLKTYLEPLLRTVVPFDPYAEKAQELLSYLDLVGSWDDRHVPKTSILREFIGGGTWDHH